MMQLELSNVPAKWALENNHIVQAYTINWQKPLGDEGTAISLAKF